MSKKKEIKPILPTQHQQQRLMRLPPGAGYLVVKYPQEELTEKSKATLVAGERYDNEIDKWDTKNAMSWTCVMVQLDFETGMVNRLDDGKPLLYVGFPDAGYPPPATEAGQYYLFKDIDK